MYIHVYIELRRGLRRLVNVDIHVHLYDLQHSV